MAASITYTQGIFKINGIITAENSIAITNDLKKLLLKTDRILISLDHIHTIDITGVHALTALYRNAIRNNKIITIIGKANKKVAKAFGKNNYIIRNDFF